MEVLVIFISQWHNYTQNEKIDLYGLDSRKITKWEDAIYVKIVHFYARELKIEKYSIRRV